MKKRKIVAIAALLLAACLLICGCDGMKKTKSVEFRSVYTDEIIKLKISTNKYLGGTVEGGRVYYETKRTASSALDEIANNDGVQLKYMCGYTFFSVENKSGIYYLQIEPSERKGYKNTVQIIDMRCRIRNGQTEYENEYFVFPYFMLFKNIAFEYDLELNKEYSVSKDLLIQLINELNIYEKITELDNGLQLEFKNKTLVIHFTDTGIKITDFMVK